MDLTSIDKYIKEHWKEHAIQHIVNVREQIVSDAHKRMCVCDGEQRNDHHFVVQTVELEEHELEQLLMYYCSQCDSVWCEP